VYAGVRMPTWCNQLSIYDMDTCSSMRVRALQSRREPCSECVLCCAFHVHVGFAGAGSCGAGVLRAHRRASVRSRVCVCVCVCVCMGVRVCVCARTWRARVCEMGCTCVGSRCGSSSHRRSHGTQEWHLFRLAACMEHSMACILYTCSRMRTCMRNGSAHCCTLSLTTPVAWHFSRLTS